MKGEGMIRTSQWGKRSKRDGCSRSKGRRCFKEGVIGSATYCAWVQDDEDGELSVGLAPGLWEPVVRLGLGPKTDCSGIERMGEVDIGHRQLQVLPFICVFIFSTNKLIKIITSETSYLWYRITAISDLYFLWFLLYKEHSAQANTLKRRAWMASKVLLNGIIMEPHLPQHFAPDGAWDFSYFFQACEHETWLSKLLRCRL